MSRFETLPELHDAAAEESAAYCDRCGIMHGGPCPEPEEEDDADTCEECGTVDPSHCHECGACQSCWEGESEYCCEEQARDQRDDAAFESYRESILFED